MFRILKHINLLVALVGTIFIIYFLPNNFFAKYRVDKIYKGKAGINSHQFLEDLNNDGNEEQIIFDYNKTSLGHVLMILTKDGKNLYYEALPSGYYFVENRMVHNNFFCDYNGDGIKELFFLTLYNDTVYLDIRSFDKGLEDSRIRVHKPICRYLLWNGKPDVYQTSMYFADLNNDGYKDVIFSLNGTYAIQPRRAFVYDIRNNILYQSPKTSVNYYGFVYDEESGLMLNSNFATGNTLPLSYLELFKNSKNEDSLAYYNRLKIIGYKYGDFSSYIFVLNKKLEFQFPPIKTGDFNFSTDIIYVKPYIYALTSSARDTNFVPTIRVVEPKDGKIVKEKKFTDYKGNIARLVKTDDGFAIFFKGNKDIVVYDTSFNVKKKLLNSYTFFDGGIDLNGDNKYETILYDDSHIYIYSEDFLQKVVIPITYCGNILRDFRVYKVAGTSYFSFIIGDSFFEFKYHRNTLYFVRYIFYFVLFILVYLFFYLITKAHSYWIKKDNVRLEKLVYERTKELASINEELSLQNERISEQRDQLVQQKKMIEGIHTDLMESIEYARRLQRSIFPNPDILLETFSDMMVLFMPKDKVSGDFYWWVNVDDITVVAVSDCTGHGVPGAFMSMLGIAFLWEIVNKENVMDAGMILDAMREKVIAALGQKGAFGEQKDGMDMSVIIYNTKTNILEYAGANNPVYWISEQQEIEVLSNQEKVKFFEKRGKYSLYELRPDKMPIAYYVNMNPFSKVVAKLNKGDILYLFTDGFADQLGGPKNKKYKTITFKRLLLENAENPLIKQKYIIKQVFVDWRESFGTQIDDVTVIGVRL